MPECAVVSPVDQHLDRRPLAELADHVADRLSSYEMQLLLGLAADGALNPEIFDRAVAAALHGLPYASLAVLRAMQTLVCLAGHHPEWPAHCSHNAWLSLARVHALRRERRAAGDALDGAAKCSRGRSHGTDLAQRFLAESQKAVAAGHYPEARRWLVRGRNACARSGDQAGQAEAALELSQLTADLGRFPKAQMLAGEAATLGASDPWLACRALLQNLDVQYYQTHYVEADRGYVSIAGECLAAGWQIDYAHVRVMQGLLATQQGNLPQAHEHLAAAMVFYRAEEALYYVGVCLRAIAMLWRRQGRFAEAAAEAHAALDTFQDLGDMPGIGRCHQALGLIYQEWNRYDVALAEYERALAILEDIGLRIDPLAIRLNQAEIQAERGYSHAALACYEQSLRSSLTLHADRAVAHCLYNMAMLNGRLGSYAEAAVLYGRARRRFSRLQVGLDAQLCAARQAGLLDLLGEHRQARRLLAAARRYLHAGNHELPLAFCELIMGEIVTNAGQRRTALAHFETALAYFAAHGHDLDAALCRLLIGETHLASGDPAAALPPLESAAERFTPDLPDQAARAEHALGQAVAALGEPQKAAVHHQAAVSHLTRARHGILTESQASRFVASREPVYDAAIAACLSIEDPAAALTVVEAAKGQVLVALLQQREVLHAAFAGQSSQVRELWEEVWQVSRQLDALRARWPSSQSGGPGGARGMIAISEALSQAPTRAAGQLADLAARQAGLFERLRHTMASFDLLNLPAEFSLAGLRETARRSWGPGWSALAYYHYAEDCLLVLWVTEDTVRAWQRPLTPLLQAKLKEACNPDPQQREVVYAGALRGVRQPNPPGPRLLRSLGNLLIPEEVQAALAPDRPLLISPHGQLHYLPFHALPLAGGRPLVEQALVSYAPTLHVWETLTRRVLAEDEPYGIPADAAHSTGRHAAGRSAQAGAAARMQKALILGMKEFGDRAPALELAEDEAQAVARQWRQNGADPVALLGQQATLEQLQAWNDDDTLRSFDVIHFATHAVYAGSNPLLSRILLADGALAVPDVFRLRLEARLVTLSACQTALSSLYSGDELLGLREALLYAGARSLLVSLWHVDDASTGDFMNEFYCRLLAGQSPTLALAATQRAMLGNGANPYNWAPFVLIG